MRCRWFGSMLAAVAAGCGGADGRLAAPHATATPRASAATAAPAPPRAPFEVAYREPANAFEILDNLSGWWPERSDAEYRKWWKEHVGLDAADDARFALYARVRSKYRAAEDQDDDPTRSPHGLFARDKPVDRVAEAFYGARTRDDAWAALANVMAAEDVAALRGVFDAYEPKLRPLLEESRTYERHASAMAARLGNAEVSVFVERLRAFYGAPGVPETTVVYAWWPPGADMTANARGRFVVMKANPGDHAREASEAFDVVVHELAHRLSLAQPTAQKQSLTRTFLAGCPVPRAISGPRVLEEPLAVATQKLLVARVAPSEVDFSRTWYGDPWVSALAKQLYGQLAATLEAGRPMDEATMRRAARSCKELLSLGMAMSR